VEKKLPDGDIVVLLTDHPDLENWFSAGEFGERNNYFIHTDWWEYFVESDPVYPVVYELASVPLLYALYDDYADVVKSAHEQPKGCYLDMCRDKTQIHLKMRTADICQDCRRHFTEREVDPALIRQILAIFENVRGQMLYRERLDLLAEPSKMVVDEKHRTLLFPQVHPVPLELSPQYMTIYAFFLNHPKGVYFQYLNSHRDELYYLYLNISSRVEFAKIKNSVDNLIRNPVAILNPILTNINKKITQKVGERIAGHYHITSVNGPHSIKIDREKYVTYSSRYKFHPSIRLRDEQD